MPRPATILPFAHVNTGIGTARVAGRCDTNGCVPICSSIDSEQHPAHLAIHPRPHLIPGDQVLTATDGNRTTYIIGVLSVGAEHRQTDERIRLSDGTEARLDRSAAHESLKLYSSNNELLIDYQSRSGSLTVHAPSGDLEFTADHGGIVFRSSKGICMDSDRVVLKARNEIQLGIQPSDADVQPVISINHRAMKLTTPALDLVARRANLFVEETQIAGKRLLGRIADIRYVARKIESVADTIMAKARNVYRTVSELSQLKAGRQRTIVENTIHTKAAKTILKSEHDFKIKAEKIHLG